MYKAWTAASAFISGILACYTDLNLALFFFCFCTVLDTITSIHAQATLKGLQFNPLKKYFWTQIKSYGLRMSLQKIFWEYGTYLLIAFAIDKYVLKNNFIFEIYYRQLTLPVIAVYLFAFIELWSVGENIEKAGGINIFKKILHFIPDKYQRIFKSDKS